MSTEYLTIVFYHHSNNKNIATEITTIISINNNDYCFGYINPCTSLTQLCHGNWAVKNPQYHGGPGKSSNEYLTRYKHEIKDLLFGRLYYRCA